MHQLIKIYNYFKQYILLFLILLLTVDAAFSQLQIFLFNGDILIPFFILKLLLLLILIIDSTTKKIWITNKFVFYWWLFFLIYIVIEVFVFTSSDYNYSFKAAIYRLLQNYFIFMVVPAIFALRESFTKKKIVVILSVLFIILAIIGFIQYFSLDPLFPDRAKNEVLIVNSYIYFGKIRSFSLFTSAMAFGHFIAMFSAIVFSYMCIEKKKWIYGLLFTVTVATSYITLTRNVYLELIASILNVIFLLTAFKYRRLRDISNLLPVLNGLIGICFFYLSLVKLGTKATNISNNTSIQMRWNEWKNVTTVWLKHSDWMHKLFGTGIVQGDKIGTMQPGLIDNNFLLVGLHIGIIGLILWLIIMFYINAILIKETFVHRSPLLIGLTAFWSTWMITGIYNITLNIYMVVLILIVLVYDLDKKAQKLIQ